MLLLLLLWRSYNRTPVSHTAAVLLSVSAFFLGQYTEA